MLLFHFHGHFLRKLFLSRIFLALTTLSSLYDSLPSSPYFFLVFHFICPAFCVYCPLLPRSLPPSPPSRRGLLGALRGAVPADVPAQSDTPALRACPSVGSSLPVAAAAVLIS